MRENRWTYSRIMAKIFVDVIRTAPGWIIMDSSAMLLSSVCYAFATVVRQWLFDTIQGAAAGRVPYAALLTVTAVVVLFHIGNELLNAVCNFTWFPAMRTVEGRLRTKIHKKIKRLPCECFEDVETLACIEKANQGVSDCYGVYNSVATVCIFYLPYFAVMGVYLWRLEPILLLCLVFLFAPTIMNLFIRRGIFERQVDETVPLQREKEYYETEIFSGERLKENRLFGSFSFFFEKYRDVNQRFCKKRWRAQKRADGINLLMKFLTLGGYLGIIVLLLVFMLQNRISVGAFAAVFSSITTMITFMADAIDHYLSNLFDHAPMLKRYVEFFDIPEETCGRGEIRWEDRICLRHISYVYPGSDKKVLDDISFDIRAGQTVALVGENGAGKSTLVHILAGLYAPTAGRVEVDGKNLYAVCPEDRFSDVSAVFQKFNRYRMSVRGNVAIAADVPGSEEDREKWLWECIRQSEFRIDENFDRGLDTMLSREFDGIDLSGGQWQRLALARGLYRQNRLIVLDEPTSAIDPLEEGILYRKFREMIRGRMGVIVTHRLGSARLADHILVLKKGRVAEQGRHEELLEKDGYYAKMWREQAKWYQEVKECFYEIDA